MLADWFVIYLVMPVFVPILISSHAVAGEKEKRTLEPLLASPVTPLELVIGKVARLAGAARSCCLCMFAFGVLLCVGVDVVAVAAGAKSSVLPNAHVAVRGVRHRAAVRVLRQRRGGVDFSARQRFAVGEQMAGCWGRGGGGGIGGFGGGGFWGGGGFVVVVVGGVGGGFGGLGDGGGWGVGGGGGSCENRGSFHVFHEEKTMGILDSFKSEAQRNFIARADEAKDDIIYKYPERNIRLLTQLTVQADEVAIFVKDGVIAGKLGPGRHNLDTNNVPFISALLEKVTGGDLFIAEVYFVTLREFASLKFGGPIGDVRDPDTSLGIGTMVYGDFSLKVHDPEKLVLGLVGMRKASNDEFLGWFKSQVLKVTRDRIAELIVKKKWPLLDVTSGAYTEEIETEVIAGGVKQHVELLRRHHRALR